MATLVLNYAGVVNERVLFTPALHRLKRDANWFWLDVPAGSLPSESALKSLWLSFGARPLRLILLIDPEMVAAPPRPLADVCVESCWVVVIDTVAERTGPEGIPKGAGEDEKPGIANVPYRSGGVLHFIWPRKLREQIMQLSYLLILLADQDLLNTLTCARVELVFDDERLEQHLIALKDRFTAVLEKLAGNEELFELKLLDEDTLVIKDEVDISGGALQLEKPSFGLMWQSSDRERWDKWLANAGNSLKEKRASVETALCNCAESMHRQTPHENSVSFSRRTMNEKMTAMKKCLEEMQQSWRRPGSMQEIPPEDALWSDLRCEYTSRFEEVSRLRPNVKVALLAAGAALLLLFSGFAAGVSIPLFLPSATPLALLLLSCFGLWISLRTQNGCLRRFIDEVRDKLQRQLAQIDNTFVEQKKAMGVIAKIRVIQFNIGRLEEKQAELDRMARLRDFHRLQVKQRLAQIDRLLIDPSAGGSPCQVGIDPSRRDVFNPCYDGAAGQPQPFEMHFPVTHEKIKVDSELYPGLMKVTFVHRLPHELFGTAAARLI